MIVAQALTADFDQPNLSCGIVCANACLGLRILAYEFMSSFVALPRQGRVQVMFMTPRRESPAGA